METVRDVLTVVILLLENVGYFWLIHCSHQRFDLIRTDFTP